MPKNAFAFKPHLKGQREKYSVGKAELGCTVQECDANEAQ